MEDQGPETPSEQSFCTEFANLLKEAQDFTRARASPLESDNDRFGRERKIRMICGKLGIDILKCIVVSVGDLPNLWTLVRFRPNYKPSVTSSWPFQVTLLEDDDSSP